MLLNCDAEKTLESPLDSKIKPVNPKGNEHWIFIGRTNAEVEAQYFGHLMRRADSLDKTLMLGKIEGNRGRGYDRGCDVGWHHWFKGCEFEQTPGDSEGQGSLSWSSWRHIE